ncbi:MAG: sulfurtransferase-like selenium metabolism protein YedF [Bacillota bacterium]|uniref:sulfurtransferase-like selenium metabolism protein YedF n=1 Tax=Desulforudis sp. DRI-14 TaxID=3459793 RepID=UPI0034944AF4
MGRSKTLDCRGLACPQPVLATKEALSEPGVEHLVTIVDNAAARENVTRFAQNAGWEVEAKDENGVYYLTLRKPGTVPADRPRSARPAAGQGEGRRPVYLVTSNVLGQGPQDLGQVLMKSVFVSLNSIDTVPDALIFLNSGVYLCVEGSPVLEQVRALEVKGTAILVCGTCLDYYGVKDRLAAGRITNMLEVQETLVKASPPITLA